MYLANDIYFCLVTDKLLGICFSDHLEDRREDRLNCSRVYWVQIHSYFMMTILDHFENALN